MLSIALLLGIYSYSILALGLLGFLRPVPIVLLSFPFVIFLVVKLGYSSLALKRYITVSKKSEKGTLAMILALFLVALLGVLGPETGFDALWYHLTIPKIFIERQAIDFIEGNLFYYSLLPKTAEMLYIPPIMLGGENLAKLTHYAFSVMTSIVLYQMIRLYLKRNWALAGVLIFNSSLVVGWLMTSAYVDMIRAFYESLSLLYLLKFAQHKERKYLLFSSLLLGFAISVKIVSFVSIPSFLLIVLFFSRGIRQMIGNVLSFIFFTILVPVPWFLIALYYKANPFYPFFTNLAPQSLDFSVLNPLKIFENLINIFLFSSDPINPVYLMIFPITFFINWEKLKKIKILIVYFLTTITFWYLSSYLNLWHATGDSGSARFLTSYLPGYTVITVFLISKLDKKMQDILLLTVFIISFISIVYRTVASIKYLPVIFGTESKQEFLMKRLNFNFGDFYDENNEIKNIVKDDLVLLSNMHNLYYINFNFTIEGWDNSKEAKYLLHQGNSGFLNLKKPIYQNKSTNVKLYRL